MKKLFALVLLAYFNIGIANAQSGVSPNLVDMSSGNSYFHGNNQLSLTGTVNYTGTGGGYSGGNIPGYNSSTNTIYFGYSQSTVAYTYAFSQALQNSGMTILGYNYGWDYLNEGQSSGNLSALVNFASTTGTSLHSRSWTLGPTTGWTNVTGTETFTSPGLLASNIANFSLTFNGKDSRFWAGYYGPQVRNPSLSLNYTFDVCSSNPLSSPTCPGYEAAYLTQQCSANALYSPSCPGYAAAYFTQQCSINPLSDPACPGYAGAYLTYQCSINPLFSTTCSGYEQAYFNQQCQNNGLYSKNCPNYSTAYATKMLLEQQGMASTVATAGVIAQNAPTQSTPSTSVSSDGTVSTSVSKTGNNEVDKAITPTTSTTNSAAAPAAPVQLNPPSPGQNQPQQAGGDRKQERKEEPGGRPNQTAQQENKGGDKPKTAGEQLKERRETAAKEKAVQEGKNLADNMGKAADMEQQKAIQNVVLQAMSFVPGFDVYRNAVMVDRPFYRQEQVYKSQTNVDNRNLGRRMFGPSDRLHEQMIDSQYELKSQ